MAFTARHNITTVLTQNLVAAGDNVGNITSIHLANVHASDAVNVDLIVNGPSNSNHYIIKNVSISSGTSLTVDTKEIPIDTRSNGDSLRIKLSAATPIDVLINATR